MSTATYGINPPKRARTGQPAYKVDSRAGLRQRKTRSFVRDTKPVTVICSYQGFETDPSWELYDSNAVSYKAQSSAASPYGMTGFGIAITPSRGLRISHGLPIKGRLGNATGTSAQDGSSSSSAEISLTPASKPTIWASTKLEISGLVIGAIIAVIVAIVALILGNGNLALLMIPPVVAALLGTWLVAGAAKVEEGRS